MFMICKQYVEPFRTDIKDDFEVQRVVLVASVLWRFYISKEYYSGDVSVLPCLSFYLHVFVFQNKTLTGNSVTFYPNLFFFVTRKSIQFSVLYTILFSMTCAC